MTDGLVAGPPGAAPAVTTYWCELAWLGDATGHVESGVTVTVAGDRITAVTAGVQPPAGATQLGGLTVPGFANAHSHAFHRALRGRTHGATGSFWTWRAAMYELAARLDPDRYLALATATFAEMALAGYSCAGEFHYLHHAPGGRPYDEPNVMGEVLRCAAADAGIRLTLLDTCYLDGGFGTALDEVQQRFGDGDTDSWTARADALPSSDTVRIGAAIHSVRAVDPASVTVVSAWAADRTAPLHAHVSEQPAENEECRLAHGCTPVELLDRQGALTERFTAVHATHLVDADVALLARAGATCCLCPTTERDLADGIGPSAAFRSAGVPMCLGTDSHAVIDPFEDARAVELDERLVSMQRGTHRAGELLAMATVVGHRSLGWTDAGLIAPGMLADLTTISLDSVRLAGTDASSADAAVVFAASAADVRHVVVGGRVIVRDGAHVRIDVAGALDRSIRDVWA
ncbi:MAG: formimidoylglutamate deiminase [Acidimicrobiia bacterium]